MEYNVGKEKGGRFYVYRVSDGNPIPGTYRKENKEALKLAAEYEGCTYKEFLKNKKIIQKND